MLTQHALTGFCFRYDFNNITNIEVDGEEVVEEKLKKTTMMRMTVMRGAALLSWLLVSPALAAQPSAPKPVPAPLRDLEWGQLNILHTTDTHGWLAGHLQEYDCSLFCG